MIAIELPTDPFGAWLAAFALTLAIEVPVVVLLWRTTWGPATLRTTGLAMSSLRLAVPTAAVANLLTHPLGIGVLLPLVARPWGPTVALAVIESLVIIVEMVVYARRLGDWVGAAAVSGAANIASFGLGMAILA